jgi:hypothetical protein
MAHIPKAITIRPTAEDYKIVVALCRKLEGNASSVIRQALRVLAEKQKVKV